MDRDLILGTAGHIDHGKTSLIQALTGTDCDRLPEEKARGITIDLGFARLELGGVTFGIVDVPGHERFIKNMLAGATGIDLALLVVSAGESVKPQTREHIEILQFLGVKRGVIALTKIDQVDDDTCRVVELEIRDAVAGTFLEAAPIIPTSATTARGIDALKAALADAAMSVPENAAEDEPFRLAIDRAFVVQGHGTVVTGTVVSGSVSTGDEVDWHRADGVAEVVRVRGINNHNRQVERAVRGQRAALNLAGVSHDAIRREQELATPGYLRACQTITVELRVSSSARRTIKNRQPVRVHLGTAEILGTVSLLDKNTVELGGSAYAQLLLLEPATAVWGQRFVLRDSSAEETIGGGRVLQPYAAKVRRRHWDQLERIEQLGSDDPAIRAEAGVWFAGPAGFRAEDSRRELGIHGADVREVCRRLSAAGLVLEIETGHGGRRCLHAKRVGEIESKVLGELLAFHERLPLLSSHDAAAVLARCSFSGDLPLLHAVAARMRRNGLLVGDERRIARADFQTKLSAAQRKLKDKIVAAYQVAGFQPPEQASFANFAGGNAASLGELIDVACAEGLLVRVDAEVCLHADAATELIARVTERLRSGGTTVSELRDLLGTTRKFAIPMCEYLDRIGVTRRNGDLRELVNESGGTMHPRVESQ